MLRGAAIFMADLVREIHLPIEMDYMAISSYGNGAKSRGRTDTGKAHSPTVGDFCRMWTGLEDGAFRKREPDTISGTGEASVGSHV